MAGRVAVALGAGGARGYAHIGALEVLQERGYEVVALSGAALMLVLGIVPDARALSVFANPAPWTIAETCSDWCASAGVGDPSASSMSAMYCAPISAWRS